MAKWLSDSVQGVWVGTFFPLSIDGKRSSFQNVMFKKLMMIGSVQNNNHVYDIIIKNT